MNTSEQYYCVGCGKFEPLEQAQQLFRTGFFRVIHPLGCCSRCSEEKPAANRLDGPELPGQSLGEPRRDYDDICIVFRGELQVQKTFADVLVRI